MLLICSNSGATYMEAYGTWWELDLLGLISTDPYIHTSIGGQFYEAMTTALLFFFVAADRRRVLGFVPPQDERMGLELMQWISLGLGGSSRTKD